ncbi:MULTISPECIES: alpha/beta fold hydrolase [unclassified Roseitalea]|uniref:alpha/beta fold hydrolase n=1 Tax=unclassified Roseitalea TaxID=2639107 RepID=UPI00273EC4B7|nr:MULTISPECIES: alpha/beta fold hydrolase [unclassified Roseitalea]
MPVHDNDGVSIHYEVLGDGPPLLMLAGLAGIGRSWGPQVDLFARSHSVILPDHRGTGRSDHVREGMTIAQHARDMAGLVRSLDIGPVAVLGSSTGGAIAQEMAIDHGDTVSAIVLANSLARSDAYYDRQFEVRRTMLRDSGLRATTEANSLFLFSPAFTRDHPEAVEAWIEAASRGPLDMDIALARIDMIVAHDTLDRLDRIACPTLVIAGADDHCTPPHMSRQLADSIADAWLEVLPSGHLGFLEMPEAFHRVANDFLGALE